MSGLVMGITVHERSQGEARLAASVAPAARTLRLIVRPGTTPAGRPRFVYALHERGPESGADTAGGIGPTLDLVRGAPVRITVVNRLQEPTAVHWHGIELESYFDGVPGFSGIGRRVTPMIAPGDSFEVRFTPPRAGTFIYHTHANEIAQQLGGLAGSIVVREPGPPRDAARDMTLLVTERGHPDSVLNAEVVVNGSREPAPIRMVAGTTYRLRIIQLATSLSALRLELFDGPAHAAWTVVAKDGADLPPSRRVPVPSRVRLGIGETFDVEFTPLDTGMLRLDVNGGIQFPAPAPTLLSVPIHVRRAGAG